MTEAVADLYKILHEVDKNALESLCLVDFA